MNSALVAESAVHAHPTAAGVKRRKKFTPVAKSGLRTPSRGFGLAFHVGKAVQRSNILLQLLGLVGKGVFVHSRHMRSCENVAQEMSGLCQSGKRPHVRSRRRSEGVQKASFLLRSTLQWGYAASDGRYSRLDPIARHLLARDRPVPELRSRPIAQEILGS